LFVEMEIDLGVVAIRLDSLATKVAANDAKSIYAD
jgi:hypothetical protein